MADLSAKALELAIVALLHERRRAIEIHNAMDPDDEGFEEAGSYSQEIDSVLGEFEEEYESARALDPGYPSFRDMLSHEKAQGRTND